MLFQKLNFFHIEFQIGLTINVKLCDWKENEKKMRKFFPLANQENYISLFSPLAFGCWPLTTTSDSPQLFSGGGGGDSPVFSPFTNLLVLVVGARELRRES